MKSKNWIFDQLIINHFPMYDSYLSNNISAGFFLILITMATSGLFKDQPSTSSRIGEIILLFTPFVFVHVHGLGLLEKYDIRYIEEEELDDPEAN